MKPAVIRSSNVPCSVGRDIRVHYGDGWGGSITNKGRHFAQTLHGRFRAVYPIRRFCILDVGLGTTWRRDTPSEPANKGLVASLY